MIELLKAAEQHLQSSLTYALAHGGNIFITPDVNYISHGVGFPAIGIKDGKPVKRELTGGVIQWEWPLIFAVFSQVRKSPSAPIIGDPSTNTPGVLQMLDDVAEQMVDNCLGLDGFESAFETNRTDSRFFVGKKAKLAIQQALITITWTIETEGICGS